MSGRAPDFWSSGPGFESASNSKILALPEANKSLAHLIFYYSKV